METQLQTNAKAPEARNKTGTPKFVQACRHCLSKQGQLRAGSHKAWFVVLVIGVLLVLTGSAFGQVTKTWVPTNGGSWATASNWNPSGVPAAGNYVSIPNDQSNTITNVPTISLHTLHIGGNCTLSGASSPVVITVTDYLYVHSLKVLRLGNGNRINFILASTAKGNIQGTVTIYSGSTRRYFSCEGDLSIALNGLINNSGASNFILAAGATLRIFSTAGITRVGTAAGNIQTTGIRAFDVAANYVYDGVNAQNTGTGLPTNLIGQLLIANTAGVTLVNENRWISGKLYLYGGTFTINPSGTQRLSMVNDATIIRRDGSINSTGVLQGTGAYEVNFINTSKTTGPELLNAGLRNVTVNLNTGTTLTSATNAFSTTGNLTIEQGILNMQATDANYTIGGNLTVNSGATLKHSQHWDTSFTQIVLNGNLGISGAYDYSTVGRTHIGMYGAGSKTISAPNTALSILTLNLGDISATGNVTINDNFWSMFGSAGSFSTNGQVVTANAGVLINGGIVNINGGTLNVTSGLLIGHGSLNGAVNLSSGVLNADYINIGNETLSGTLTQSGGIANIGNLTIFTADDNAYTCTGSPAINISGNWTNNRAATAFTPANSTVTFNGSAEQSIGGSFNTSFYNLAFANTGAAVTFNSAHNISNNFSIATGSMAFLGTFTHSANTLTLSGNGAASGSWGGITSSADNIDPGYFAEATGIINVTNNTCTGYPVVSINKTDLNCFGAGNGEIAITATGGSGTLYYSINEGTTWQTGSSFSGLPAGNYPVRVKDSNGCIQTNCTIL